MHISKLRLLGFKSFVEPTELLIEQGLTGVVGPNGCGKSNLVEALRWVMGETSYKSMRASSMDDVIFNGTNLRPPRNMAEVTIFIDNAKRTAPAEFNDHDVLEVTRRIEREMGSAYRVNGRDARAKDIKLLFEDAATGARSPALVRQGQISEIVNAKPEQRRRILEDAAGIAGLHSRRHEAELRLRGAEANLARVTDVLGQLSSQLESLKRQVRHAKRYKELSAEIRKTEALLHHAFWLAIEADITTEERHLGEALAKVAAVTEQEASLIAREHEAATQVPGLRDIESQKAAAFARIKVEQENFEREAERAKRRLIELQERSAQMKRDLAREEQMLGEAKDTLARLTHEKQELERTNKLAVDFETRGEAALTQAEAAVRIIEQRLNGLQTAAAEARARRNSFQAQRSERAEIAARLERQLATLEAQARDITAKVPDLQQLKQTTETGQALATALADLEAQMSASEEQVEILSVDAKETRDAAAAATLKAGRLGTEVATLTKLLRPATPDGATPVLDDIKVDAGFEMALGVALGDDLDAPTNSDAAVHWSRVEPHTVDPKLPDGVESLLGHVAAPLELARRLAQIGMVARGDGARLQKLLKAGQRLVSREGDLWRWDGFIAGSHGTTAAGQRLAERNRLGALIGGQEHAEADAARLSTLAAQTAGAHTAAEGQARRLRGETRATQAQLATLRDSLTGMERAAREVEQRLTAVTDARDAARDALVEATEKLTEIDMALDHLGESDPFEDQLAVTQEDAIEKRAAVAEARAELATLEREHRQREERLKVIVTETERWSTRFASAEEHVEVLRERIATAEEEALIAAEIPDGIDEQRQRLLDTLAVAEVARNNAADALAAADSVFRETQTALRALQASIGQAREGMARTETRLEAARARRVDHIRKTQEALGVLPDGCLALAEHPVDAPLPKLADIEQMFSKAKADRDRLGGVNLAAEDELAKLDEQFGGLDKERQDVEDAIAKLRGGINELNKEAKGRLNAAFETVNGHFQRLFGILFNGGEASLQMLESPEDPLAGGLEILAKPPGKKPATLSLLSGGEQTLTALSLIFAVFLTNPSPICVLDEVDAPLDDANVDRFCTMMERMSADTTTRFLVITHHPQTMARMNRLFGVTMAEKGVSQLVSVNLEVARELVDEDVAA